MSACAAPAPSGIAATDTAAEKPEHGGTVYVTVRGAPVNVHTYKDVGVPTNTTVAGPVYEGLLNFDYTVGDYRDELKIVPGLADRWEQPDPTTYLFHLRKGVQFHDGSTLNAE